MQIGTLAVRTGASQKALRYYEQLGVLAPARGENGYREYREADVRVVEVVRSLGRLGIPVEQTRPFLDCLGAGHEHPDDCVASMAAYRMAIAQLSERIDALTSMREELVARLEHAAARANDGRTDERQDIVSDYMSLPSDLPAPEDDGAADHLVGALLRALRAEPGMRNLPVILVSARAGEESRVEGLEAGADDYLVKPFSARELIARVNAHLTLAEGRAEAFAREEAARAEAERANRAKDDFLAVLSHELRTPLTAMLGWVRLLRAGRLEAAATQRALEVIERNVQLQSRLISDLLDISRIVAGKMTLERAVVDLTALVAGVVETLRPTAEDKSLALTAELSPMPIPVDGDAERLRQVVVNLLSNAVKFTPGGGRVTVGLERLADQARLTVSDTGRGISAEFLPSSSSASGRRTRRARAHNPGSASDSRSRDTSSTSTADAFMRRAAGTGRARCSRSTFRSRAPSRRRRRPRRRQVRPVGRGRSPAFACSSSTTVRTRVTCSSRSCARRARK